MKIEHEMKGVQVVRRATIADALEICYGKRPLRTLGIWHRDPHPDLTEMLKRPLWRGHEGARIYERTLALATLDRDMQPSEFYREAARNDWYPASISEGLSYLSKLGERGVKVDQVFHLGTALRSEQFTESRLFTTKSGEVKLIPFYPKTILKAFYHIVVVREVRQPRRT